MKKIIITSVLFTFNLLLLYGQQEKENKELAVNFIYSINQADTTALGYLLSENFIRFTGGVADLKGKSAMQKFVWDLKQNNPGFEFEIVQIAAGNTDIGIFWMAHSPLDESKKLSWTGCTMLGLDSKGKILTERIVGDRLGMYEQLGYILQKSEKSIDAKSIHPTIKE